MEYIKNFFNNQHVTKVRNEQNLSYYVSHINESSTNILLLTTREDTIENGRKVSIATLPAISIQSIKTKNPFRDIETTIHMRKCKSYILEKMWCTTANKRPLKTEMDFLLNNSDIKITINVENKDSSIFFTKDIKLLDLIQNFDYNIHKVSL